MGTSFTHTFVYELVTLFVILDPGATVPVFLAVTAGLSRKQSLKVAAYALAIALVVLLFFIAVGQHLLQALHIPMASFQLAGSLVLLMFGLKLVLGQISAEAAALPEGTSLYERAIYPLAIPGIAGPGAILTVVLLTDNNRRTFAEQATTTGELVICLLVLFGLFFVCVYLLPSLTCEERERGVLLAQVLSPATTGEILAAKFLFYPAAGLALGAALAALYRPGVLLVPFFWLALAAAVAGSMGVGLVIASLAAPWT